MACAALAPRYATGSAPKSAVGERPGLSGAAGAILIILLWVYYSAQIFLLGAEFTRAYAERHGSHAFERQTDNEPSAVLQPKTDLRVSSTRIPAERAAYR